MRKLLSILAAVLITAIVWAQGPQKISYQAVIRDVSNKLVANQKVGMRISILQVFANGKAVYTETQTPTTDANGLVSIEIGGGAGFDAINWGANAHFLKTETDPTGGTTYTITGTSQLLSVPYALHALSYNADFSVSATGDTLNLGNGKRIFIPGISAANDGSVAGVPTISSFNPLSGIVGATVILTGTNFNATPANNIVFFGATRATVSAATATSLTVTVPSGATCAPITVLNTKGTMATYSRNNFIPTFSPAKTSITAGDFATMVDIATVTFAVSVVIGDIDGDGKPDLVVASGVGTDIISVLRNTGSNSFAPAVTFATGASPRVVTLGDIDGDGKLDMATANRLGNTVSVLRNTSSIGSISFTPKLDLATGIQPVWVSIGNIDADGKPDLVVTNCESLGTVSVLRNTGSLGNISFAAKVDFATGSMPRSVVIGDIDGDEKPDLAVANASGATGNTVSVLRNVGISGIDANCFAANINFATGTNPYSIAIGDIDGDGKPDLVTTNKGAAAVSVLRNASTSGIIDASSFDAKVDITTGSSPICVVIGDVNGDGKSDLAVVNNIAAGSVSVLVNTGSSGSISFAGKVDLAVGDTPFGIAIGDLNGDGKPDIAVANENSNTISVLRNIP